MYAKALACILVTFSTAAWAEEVRVTVTRQDCARLLRHVPAADVAYQPGVGVKGRKVAPADLPGSGADLKVLPETFEFTIGVNPVNYAQRNAAMKRKGEAEAATVANYQAVQAATAALATLGTEKATLDTAAATLATTLSDAQTDRNTAQGTVDTMATEVAAGTRYSHDAAYTRAKRTLVAKQALLDTAQAAADANSAAITANTAQQAAKQAIIDAGPAAEAAQSNNRTSAESTLSGLSARGLDDSSMKVGTVSYDPLKGTFLFNGQPLGSDEARDLAEACAKRGVK